ncbi:sigma-70 family RNA polymerase sigma factor [Myxococcus sp. RHST-1-4]|nr:sigma-70 family RNA polymerase sigma factor [Myxococcus sp. RHSTA-1-4]MBZ4416040.1 sigma-70 family RNA polymerase sigma factor [Myxococcus sp. RHSTA-1-4]
MGNGPGLVATFVTHARVRLAPPGDPAPLESLLSHAWNSSRARWPGVDVSAETFVRHLAERFPEVGPGSPLAPVLESLSVEELYLACACARGLPLATEAFEVHYLAKLPGMLAYLKQPAAVVDDICQLTRVKLLVHTPGKGPRINDYTGRGALMSWVRVTAVRIALKLQAAGRPESDEDVAEVLEALPAPGGDAELELIRQRHQAEFRQALRDAFSALSSDERHLLRLYFLDRLSTTELGALLRVNQSTVSRWLKSARKTLHDETKRHLQARLNLSAAGFQSFLSILDSQLDLSISQLFSEEDRLGGV